MWRQKSHLLWRHVSSPGIYGNQCVRCLANYDKPTIAIRRETVNVWERRAPLAPRHVEKLVKKGVRVIVQPSNRRAYNMQEYVEKGAIIQEDLSEASVVIGVKQVPIDLLMPDKTFCFFSHTIKAQKDNMPLLDAILEKNVRLIDYEKMADEAGQRVVAFGKYAGVVGMINILHGMGLRLLALGHHTPFMHIGPSHNYRNSEAARQAVRDAGYEIALGRTPRSIGPLTFIFTGSGNVSRGAQEVFQELPHEYIEPDHLAKVAKKGSMRKVYGCVVSRDDHYTRLEGGKFDAAEFEEHPERYASTFSHKIAPYSSCIINGIYWAPNSPRLLTIPDAKTLLRAQEFPWIPSSEGCPQLPHRLIALCDISADPGGSIEFMKECTTIDKPFCLYDAELNVERESFKGDGVLICSIDNMPAQMPREATEYFGSLLLPYISEILKSDATSSFEDYNANPTVKNAVIASNGKLTPNFEYIAALRKKSLSSKKSKVVPGQKKVLILGAGYVAGPAVEYLSRDSNVKVTVVSQLKEELERIESRCPDVEYQMFDVTRHPEEVDKLVPEYDVVVSLLPYTMHPEVAKSCIKHGKNMVTASYVTPAMKELHQAAVDANVTIVNEVGVDPGIDHMLAMECFDEVKHAGGKITSYVSHCGGLPAPEDSATPLRYKFSWFPRGVLMNCLNGAKFLQNGKVVEIAGNGGLLDAVEELTFMPGFNIEGFPNRDSTKYTSEYGIDNAHTCIRGTIRYKGFSNVAKGLLKLGLLSDEPQAILHPNGPEKTWREYFCQKYGKQSDMLVDSLKDLLYEDMGQDSERLEAIVRMGLLDDDLIDKRGSPIDTLSNYLSKRLSFGTGERDMILMHHDIGVQWLDGSSERRHVSLVVYGEENGYSAMAKTVGLPTGIATKMVLEGEIQRKGMVIPLNMDIYNPILNRLKVEGIRAREVIEQY
ncbi:alpha-aminoadipic semialdehyde synthase, mitochondrial-like isoform X2 [Mercenaria mercenaria]|uniref:alpha-aminoadipic semialdehyde synthase, mitochondrial-like isoform X2 n=1 Tax=Mercenaria mercenaria TaxID=6596 RepID=UPI00234F8717|nr:alpha-aminoadipic semialdehyde synthase, mitochondrial-like isoform X2 [Mercenaria mercenaria]